jgi:hypothetical protein
LSDTVTRPICWRRARLLENFSGQMRDSQNVVIALFG